MTELPPGATPVDRLVPGSRIREWEVVRYVARGSFGQVFEARRDSWVEQETTRALKVFDPILSSAARSTLLNEFTVLRTIRHPNLLAGDDAFDLADGDLAGSVVFVMELADTDLASVVARQGPVETAQVAAVGADVARGLHALHDAGHLHGDVKPENVLVSGGTWKLGDFGVSTTLQGSYAHPGGATLDFRPPEVSGPDAAGRVHRSADVWALGITLWWAATGSHPFTGADPQLRYAAVLRGDRRPAPAGLDSRFAAVLDRWCLAPDPHHRAEAADLAGALDELADALAGRARRDDTGADHPPEPDPTLRPVDPRPPDPARSPTVAVGSPSDPAPRAPADRPTRVEEPTQRFAPAPPGPPAPTPPPAAPLPAPPHEPAAHPGRAGGPGAAPAGGEASPPALGTWWAGAVLGAIAAVVIVQVASLPAAAVDWDLGPRRALYGVVVAVLAAGAVALARTRSPLTGRALPVAIGTGLAVSAVGTAFLFGALT